MGVEWGAGGPPSFWDLYKWFRKQGLRRRAAWKWTLIALRESS